MRSFQVIVVGLVLAVAAAAQASPILDVRVDFSNKSTGPGGNWNSVAVASNAIADTAMKDFNTGLDSGMTVGLTRLRTSSNLSNLNSPSGWNTSNPGPSWLDASQNAAKDYVQAGGNDQVELDLKGLDPSLTYTVELVSAANDTWSDAYGSPTYTVIGNTTLTNTTFLQKANGYTGGQWLTWNLQPDSTGKIAVQIGKAGGQVSNIDLNALRVSATPEPATILLLSLSLFGLVRRRA